MADARVVPTAVDNPAIAQHRGVEVVVLVVAEPADVLPVGVHEIEAGSDVFAVLAGDALKSRR